MEPRNGAEAQMTEVLRGTVSDVLFFNEESGYIVFELETAEDLVTAVGELGFLEAGEEVELTGAYTYHNRYGQQFRAEVCVRTLPSTAANIERWLGGGAVPGIGRALAKRIVAEFGEFTLQVLESEPQKLSRIKGISAAKCDEIAGAAQKIFALRSLIDRLQIFGIPPAFAMKAYRRYGANALTLITENPYRLCLPGIDLEFPKADRMAAAGGLPGNAPQRLFAGFRFVLERAAEEGSTCLPLAQFQTEAVRQLEIRPEDLAAVYSEALREGLLFEVQTPEGRFVYTDACYSAEQYIADRIGAILAFSRKEDFDCTAAIAREEAFSGITYAKLQKQAIASAFSRGIMVLTGGPGTGKTTTLNAVIRLCRTAGSTVLLAAPTGRAAKRMTELTGTEAKTIHRLLGPGVGEDGIPAFQHHEQNPLSADVVIVDELSMVDVLLFASLLRALPLSCRLVLVGDEDQLPSVGAGMLLHSLIAAGTIPVVRLTEIFRQAEQSAIVRNAHCIVRGEIPDLTDKSSDFFFFDRRSAAETEKLVLDLYLRRLPRTYGLKIPEDIQVISPTRKNLLGTVNLNRLLQEGVNPPQYGKQVLKNLLYDFREGDRVMQTSNQYDIEWKRGSERGTGLFNGDMGTVTAVDRAANALRVDFDGRVAVLRGEQLSELELAYAVTVHKSQGSEFEAVILVLPETAERLSYRSLLYTAVTRAKKLLIVIGAPWRLRRMVENTETSARSSCLAAFLRGEATVSNGSPAEAENDSSFPDSPLTAGQ